ncbi:MAG: aminotransferase, partial [Actinomycetia bacterium]|nr:aminotransferase [Actinomycetes bacterium]
QAAAIAALDHSPELLAELAPVRAERSRVREALLAAEFTVPVTQSNFVWLALGEAAVPFAAHCMDHKVVVRPFAGDGVRVTVSSVEENDAFLAAATSFAQ